MAPIIKRGNPIRMWWIGHLQTSQGFAYLAVLFMVAALSISMGVVASHEHTVQTREKERDWLFMGGQYQRAIASYYQQSPNGLNELPATVDDLILDKRFLAPVRHLRQAYADPLTGEDWGLVRHEDGKLSGVYSRSQQSILIISQVQLLDVDTSAIQTHADVVFEFKPSSARAGEDVLPEDRGIPDATIKDDEQ